MKRSRKKRSLPNRILTTLAGLDLKRKRCAAVIVAAGSGSRMESSKAKQFMEIDDVPVIAHTLDAFERADCIDYTVVVTRGCDIEECKAIVSRFGFTKVARIVEGAPPVRIRCSAASTRLTTQPITSPSTTGRDVLSPPIRYTTSVVLLISMTQQQRLIIPPTPSRSQITRDL